jgi:hypothetical protein
MSLEWFPLLNGGDNSLFSRKEINRIAIPVCSDAKGFNEYAVFRNALMLYEYCLTLTDEKRCLYEVIRSNLYQKFYMDIDIDLNAECKDVYHDRNQKISIAEQLPNLIRDSIIKARPEIQRSDIMIFNSHSNEKRSFHIIVDRWCVTNSNNNRKFFNLIIPYIPLPWRQYIDFSMYKSLQNFRIYMSTKFGKNRPKILDMEHSSWEPEDNYTPQECNRQVFLASLITKTDNCVLLPFDEDEQIKEYNTIDLLETEVPKLMKIIKQMPYARCFTVSQRQNNLVIMRRLLPNFCSVCEKEHSSENPFITVSYNGEVRFDCRRHPDKKTTIIGNINSVENDEIIEPITTCVPFFSEKKEIISSQTPTETNVEILDVISPCSSISRVSSFTTCTTETFESSPRSPIYSENESPKSAVSLLCEKIGAKKRAEIKSRRQIGTILSSFY